MKSNALRIGKLRLKETSEQHKPNNVFRKPKKEIKEDEFPQQIKVKDQVINYEPVQGSGQIVASGLTVHGNATKFRTEVQKGDYLIIQHPVFKTTEEKVVTLVLSDKSLLLNDPFLEQCSTFQAYSIRKQTKVIVGHDLKEEYNKKLEQVTKTKGIKKAEMQVRLKKGMWKYESKKVEVQDNLSREQLLDVRQKLIKDKFCW